MAIAGLLCAGNILLISTLTHKKLKISFLTVFVLLTAFFCLCIDYPDYQNYVMMYDSAGSGRLENQEFLYYKIISFFSSGNVPYNVFLLITGGVSFALIHSTVKLISKNYSLIYGLYILYPFLLDVIQIRNLMMTAIVIFSIKYLVGRYRWGRFRYLICIIVASQIHQIAIVYLIFLLYPFAGNKWFKKLYVVGVLSLTFMMTNKTIKIHLGTLASGVLKNDRIEIYLTQDIRFGPFIWFILWIIMYAVIIYLQKTLYSYNSSASVRKFHLEFLTKFRKIFFLSMIIWPLLVTNLNFYRVFRNLFILLWAGAAIVCQYKNNNKLQFFMVAFCLFLFVIDILVLNRVTLWDFKDVLI